MAPEPASGLEHYSWDAAVHCWFCDRCGTLVRDRGLHERLHRQIETLAYGDGR